MISAIKTTLLITIGLLFLIFGQISTTLAQTTEGNQANYTNGKPENKYLEDIEFIFVQQVDSGNIENVKLLLELGANPNTTWFETSALMYASQRGHYEIALELLEYGAKLDTKDPSGLTALHFAASSRNDSIAELLVLNGANPHPTNDEGVSPLHYASAYGYPYMAYLLLYYGAHIDSTDVYGNTPLMASVYSGALESANYLLENWANVDKPDKQGYTPLMVASQFNDTTMMRLLTDYGANIDKQNNEGITALALAIENHSDEAIYFLLNKKASTNNLDAEITYADLAKRNGYKDLSQLFERLGNPVSNKFTLQYIAPYASTTINANDFYLGIGASALVLPYGISGNIDFGFRPYLKAIVVEDTYTTYQFFENRSIISASIAKQLATIRTTNRGTVNFSLGAKAYTSWARYNIESSVYQAKAYSLVSPLIKISFIKKNFYIDANAFWLNMHHVKKQPVTFSISAGFTIDVTKPKIESKRVVWY